MEEGRESFIHGEIFRKVMLERYRKKMEEIEARGLRRRLKEIEGSQGRILRHEGREYLNFSSNNYLGLAEEDRLKEAWIRGLQQHGVGSGSARLVNGSMSSFHKLEGALAEFKGTEAALLFNSGYHANVGALSCLAGPEDVIFSDELNHASLIDGIRLSRARKVLYRHNDLKDLRNKILAQDRGGTSGVHRILVTESLFSMDGDRCPLGELLDLAAEMDMLIYLDEAHATGVFGESGAGMAEAFRNHPAFKTLLLQMGTLGKALGCFGAYVAGPRLMIDYLLNHARTFIFTTALPPALPLAVLEALSILQEPENRRARLWKNLKFLERELQAELPELPLKVVSPIVPIIVGEEKTTLQLSAFLMEQGFWVTAIRPPTVPAGTSRLRITLMATHTEADMRALVRALREGLKRATDQRQQTGDRENSASS